MSLLELQISALALGSFSPFSGTLKLVNWKQSLIYFLSTTMIQVFTYAAGRQLSQMFLALAFFHGSEYILAIAIHGKSNVTFSSLLEHWWVSNLGLALVIVGEIIRKLAIITAGRAFTHLIRTNHVEHHNLVTHGIYKFVRHPGYSGFLIWSVGTQIMLCNPLSTIAFAIVVWRFFSQRIPYEEYFLRRFFGPQYEEYARRVPSGVPFVQ
ncbi:hypothetical protein FNV43_RR09483 [Rhamnella rubrinervis]|uniref:Protein-S-isoprenylcysteine O-methyltransferase n=1 Tax=Rhamnella rubrinervis TaxID=2594499 RepID=A0A8K0HBB1_9ROSA|nr:hypothetical protein FNV43_RR09483 [Rhamnella rubrinervis]